MARRQSRGALGTIRVTSYHWTMNPEAPAVAAIARWLRFGSRSTGHPLLAWAFDTHYAPLGIAADWLEAEPFGALDQPAVPCWLRCPRWEPARIDRRHPRSGPLLALAGRSAEASIDAAGVLSFAPSVDDAWPCIRATMRAAADAADFIHAAAALILVDEGAASLYASGEDERFTAFVQSHLDAARSASRPAEEDDTASPNSDRPETSVPD